MGGTAPVALGPKRPQAGLKAARESNKRNTERRLKVEQDKARELKARELKARELKAKELKVGTQVKVTGGLFGKSHYEGRGVIQKEGPPGCKWVKLTDHAELKLLGL